MKKLFLVAMTTILLLSLTISTEAKVLTSAWGDDTSKTLELMAKLELLDRNYKEDYLVIFDSVGTVVNCTLLRYVKGKGIFIKSMMVELQKIDLASSFVTFMLDELEKEDNK